MYYRERRAWTAYEDQLLREAVEREEPGSTNPSKWHAIAQHVPNRTNKDCRKRWCSKLATADLVKGNWAPDEDERLKEAIETCGTKWTVVATMVHTRNSDQCAKRWKDTLDPSIDRTSWSTEADALLTEAVAKHGKLWSKIAKTYFPGRTGLAAKNRYNSITRCNNAKNNFHSIRKHCTCGSEGSTPPSSGSMSPVLSAGLMPDFSGPSVLHSCLNESFPWNPVRFPDIDDTAIGSLTLDDLFTLPASNFPYSNQRTSGLEGNGAATILSTAMQSSSLSTALGSEPADHLMPILSQPSNISTPKTSVVKLYGTPFCPSTARVQVVLNEKQIPYEFINLDSAQQLDDARQFKVNFGHQPYINDGGFLLADSRAICRYLASKYADRGTKLIPGAYNIEGIALLEQAIFAEVSNFDKFASYAGYERILTRKNGGVFDEARLELSLSRISSTLDGYESILGRYRYLVGNEPTLADLYHLPCGFMLAEAGSHIMTSRGPNVARWWNDITSRESWKSVESQLRIRA